MKNQSYLNLNPCQFQLKFGVTIKTFKAMVDALKNFRLENPKDRRGRPKTLTIEEEILVTLEYWREYRTYFHIGTTWGVSESTIWRTVNDIELTLMKSGKFRIPGKKALLKGLDYPEIVVMDVTDPAIERPKRRQKKYYSGNKKRPTLKSQLVINQATREIICVAFGPGHSHDFSLFKKSKTPASSSDI
jgi:transposase